MIVKVERSGGVSGITTSKEFEATDLPSSLKNVVIKILDNQSTNSLLLNATPQGAADYFTYKITVKAGNRQRVIECNQYNMKDDVKSIVRFAEKNK